MRRAWRSRVEEPNNSIYSVASLALWVIFSVSCCGTYSVLSRSPSIMLCVNFHSQQINDDDDYELCIRLILRWRTQSRLYQVSIYLWVKQNGATHIFYDNCRQQLWTDFNNSFTVSELSSENENCWNWKWRRKSKWRCFWCAVTVVSRFTYVDLVVHIRGTSCLGLDVNKSTIIKKLSQSIIGLTQNRHSQPHTLL